MPPTTVSALLDGSFDLALHGVRLAHQAGMKVGVRYTMTEDNAHDLPSLLQLVADEGIEKFYFSHLNYAGRGNKHRADDVRHARTRWAMDLLIESCPAIFAPEPPRNLSPVTMMPMVFIFCIGPPGIIRRCWLGFGSGWKPWGGNASGVNVANIDNLGNVHPDTMWWKVQLGNVRQRPFSVIWQDVSHPLMAGLKQSPRPVGGRCATCLHLAICNGNTRVRALELTGDFWAADPACYLTDEEISRMPGHDDLPVPSTWLDEVGA
ncbi:hypothetical protein [Paludibacterium denitrificans]|uniref:hypothetical protein n=1 Tax=Paludibacterium denitrificans TaxID=2675226 RepID=UPI001E40CD74|nr:hypothetical protein [Paludibacterium denitrificans]